MHATKTFGWELVVTLDVDARNEDMWVCVVSVVVYGVKKDLRACRC